MTVEPYYQNDLVTLYHGDCREILPLLDLAADLLVTDPPYGQDWQSGRRKVKFDVLQGDSDDQVALQGVVASLKKLKRGRHAYIFGRYDFEGTTLCESAELIWDKEYFNGGNLQQPWANAHEYIQFAVHELSAVNRSKGHGRLAARLRRGTVITVPRIQSDAVTRHPTEKPVRLLRELIESSSCIDEMVLDPFAGSGSTLVAAVVEGRRAVGIEIEKQYCDETVLRLENQRPRSQ